MTEQRTAIAPAILQSFLESAPNATDKGQAQFFTPLEIGTKLASALTDFRPVITDLTCGAGHLLAAAANQSTHCLLGVDIDPCRLDPAILRESFEHIAKTTGDVTLLYPLLKEVGFTADLFVLNPPWDLHWYRDRLSTLEKSDLPAVREAFAARDGRIGRDTIDSTIATLCMALDLGSPLAEGLIICNESTIDRLVFAPDAPHKALVVHIWASVPLDRIAPQNPQFHCATAVYFSRNHQSGPTHHADLSTVACPCARVTARWEATEDSHDKWQAVSEEWKRRQAASHPHRYHVFLNPNGLITTALSLFDRHTIDTEAAKSLFQLNGKSPMQLVVQRATRRLLMEHVGLADAAFPWRVDPKLIDAVKTAVHDYESERAPLYPLPEIQRLGYLDEEDTICCRVDLAHEGRAIFRVGETYPIDTETVTVQRKTIRPSLSGEDEELELTGRELVFRLSDEDGVPRAFRRDSESYNAKLEDPSDKAFNDSLLAKHFEIPEVRDVAKLDPEGYAKNIQRLHELEALLPK